MTKLYGVILSQDISNFKEYYSIMSKIKEDELTVGETHALENGYLNFTGHDAVRAFRGHSETGDVEDMALFALGQLRGQEASAPITAINILEKIISIERSK